MRGVWYCLVWNKSDTHRNSGAHQPRKPHARTSKRNPVHTAPQLQRSPMLRNTPKIVSDVAASIPLVAALAVLVLGWVAVRFSLQTRITLLPYHPKLPKPAVANAVLNDVPQTVFVKESLQNYRAVRSGQITLQCKTGSFEALDKFFHKAGVHYNIVHPKNQRPAFRRCRLGRKRQKVGTPSP